MSNKKRNWKPQTALVHSGTLRSGFGETSEAMYLTQGYVYQTAQAAEARFKGEEPGFIYSRYANPTVDMVGHYTMRNKRGETFDIAIPAFSLDLPGTRRTVN